MVERGGKWDCTRTEATRHSMGPDLSFVICHLSFVICHLSFVICHLSFVSGQWSVVSGQWSVVSGQWSVGKWGSGEVGKWGSGEVGILASLPKWSFCAKKPRALGSGRLNGALGQLKRGYRPQWGGNVYRPQWPNGAAMSFAPNGAATI